MHTINSRITKIISSLLYINPKLHEEKIENGQPTTIDGKLSKLCNIVLFSIFLA